MSDTRISKLEQFHYENMAWERLLDFFKQENAFLKMRLSEVLDHHIEKEHLALAEQFQNRFILKDEFIDELRHDINAQEKLLKDGFIINKSVLDGKMIRQHEKLRNEMAYLERDFPLLKNEFNLYLSTVT